METEFTEIQQFRQKWLWTLLLGITAISTYFSFLDAGLRAATILLAVLTVILSGLYSVRLVTKIGVEKISYQFYPFHLKERSINTSERDIEVSKYSPLKEFGGWGLRWRPGKVAFSVSGSHCIRINSDTGREIVLGTQKPEKAEKALNER